MGLESSFPNKLSIIRAAPSNTPKTIRMAKMTKKIFFNALISVLLVFFFLKKVRMFTVSEKPSESTEKYHTLIRTKKPVACFLKFVLLRNWMPR